MSARGPARKQSAARRAPAPRRPPKCVLIVDDDLGARVHMAKTLSRKGHVLLQAGDGEEALTLSMGRKGPIHLLITDVMMPVMNGKELAERLCALRPGIRILYVSGYTREEVISEKRNCAAREWWLAKPFTGGQLLAKVREILAAPADP